MCACVGVGQMLVVCVWVWVGVVTFIVGALILLYGVVSAACPQYQQTTNMYFECNLRSAYQIFCYSSV